MMVARMEQRGKRKERKRKKKKESESGGGENKRGQIRQQMRHIALFFLCVSEREPHFFFLRNGEGGGVGGGLCPF